MKHLIVSICCLFLCLSQDGLAQKPIFYHLNRSNGLSAQSIREFYQDEIGCLWIATRDGLNRFDGNSVQAFNMYDGHSGLLGNVLFSLCGDRKGNVYGGCYQGVVKYNFVQERLTLISSDTFPMITYYKDHLLGVKQNWVYQYSETKGRFEPFINFTPQPLEGYIVFGCSNDQYIIGTRKNGIFIVSPNRRISQHLLGCEIVKLFEDKDNDLWVSTRNNGLYHCRLDGSVIRHYRAEGTGTIADNDVRGVCQDKKGNIWVGTQHGLSCIDAETKRISNLEHQSNIAYGLSNSSIRALFCDKNGTLWIGSYYGGVDYFNPEMSFYRYYNYENNFPATTINETCNDNEGRLWICTGGQGLVSLDLASGKTRSYLKRNSTIQTDHLKSILFDNESQTLWIGTNLEGLCRMDLRSGTIRRFEAHNDRNALWLASIRRILKREGKLYLGSHQTIDVIDLKTETINKLIPNYKKIGLTYIQDMVLDREAKNLWICSIRQLYCYNFERGTIKAFEQDSVFYNCLHIDKENNLWCGTDNRGILQIKTQNHTRTYFNSTNSTINTDKIIAISQGNSDFLTIATGNGIVFFKPSSHSIKNIDCKMLSPLISINEFGLNYLPDGTLFVSGINGLFSFSEEAGINTRVFSSPIILTTLYVNNRQIRPGREDGILERALPFVDKITLKAHHNSFYLYFSQTVFIDKNEQFQYRMIGLDKQWLDVPTDNRITYSNLNPGSYTLQIKNLHSHQIRNLEIIVKPPFYQSWIAYLLYLVTIGGIGFVLLRNYTDRLKLQSSLVLAEKEKEQIEAMNQVKLRFFTNVSHEFRTPLTLIIGQIEQTLSLQSLSQAAKSNLQKALSNTFRLRRLISELIEFRKQEQGFLKLNRRKSNLIPFAENIFDTFKDLARQKQINYCFETDNPCIIVEFDPAQMEKVLINLLSNAFKHTPYYKKIVLHIETEANGVCIRVADSGKGIPKADLKLVFDRFYQVDNGLTQAEWGVGSGIGLALSKGIIDEHGGSIAVESEEGVGTTFIVRLPRCETYGKEDEHALTSGELNTSFLAEAVRELESTDESFGVVNSGNQSQTVLLVDDNEELLDLLRSLFASTYHVITATNGEDGIAKAKELQPDIVVSDVLMPGLSGIELCVSLKSDLATSHIPIILLTAEGDSEAILKGLELGADDYILKPFDSKLLKARCQNILNNRKILQTRFIESPENDTSQIGLNLSDKKFLDKVIGIILDNIDNPDIHVDFMAKEMALGKTTLYAKLKGITGQPINEFIVSVRLKESTKYLLSHPDESVSIIANRFGFNSSSYYIKCFKRLFGLTPSAYRNKTGTSK